MVLIYALTHLIDLFLLNRKTLRTYYKVEGPERLHRESQQYMYRFCLEFLNTTSDQGDAIASDKNDPGAHCSNQAT